MPVCDGCRANVDDAHIRTRIQRLELATRFRPIHIHTLLIDSAPHVGRDDYFYSAAKDRTVRSAGSRACFDELMKCVGFTSGAEIHEEEALAEFQRRGLFLAYAIECPVDEQRELEPKVRNAASAVLLRLKGSYKPKHVALLSNAARGLVGPLSEGGWKDRLILDNSQPFFDPFLADPAAQAEFATDFGDRLAKALSLAP